MFEHPQTTQADQILDEKIPTYVDLTLIIIIINAGQIGGGFSNSLDDLYAILESSDLGPGVGHLSKLCCTSRN